MKKALITARFAVVVICFCLLSTGLSGAEVQAKTHADVVLKNELGETIAPDRNRTDPYSPRRTCGGCHGYATITSGYHFQQGFDEMSDRYDRRRDRKSVV